MGRMPPALAAYWAKRGRGRKRTRRVKRLIHMARRRRYGGRRRGGRKGKHGIIFGMGLFDLAQVADNAGLLGAGAAASQATTGDFEGAGNTLAQNAMTNFPNLVIHNIMWMVVKRVGRKYMGKMGKYF